MRHRLIWIFALTGLLGAVCAPAQEDGQAVQTARERAPIDLTGYWVAVVNEDWRYRMMNPPRGDVSGVPLNDEGRRVMEEWDPETDAQPEDACRYYGAPHLMRIPTRLHITWETPDTLRIETDNGRQVRRLHFGDASPPEGGSRQGFSRAEWILHEQNGEVVHGSLKVETGRLLPGYLRWNGVPYSDETTLTEYFDLFTPPDGQQYLIVKAMVDDPRYLSRTMIVSPNFKREADGSGFSPEDCWIPSPSDAEAIPYG